jgi:hypothetical protein
VQSDTGSEGNSRSSNTSPYQQDSTALLVTNSPVNTLSKNKDESGRSIDRGRSLYLSQAKSSSQSETGCNYKFDGRNTGPGKSSNRPRSAKQKQSSLYITSLMQ